MIPATGFKTTGSESPEQTGRSGAHRSQLRRWSVGLAGSKPRNLTDDVELRLLRNQRAGCLLTALEIREVEEQEGEPALSLRRGAGQLDLGHSCDCFGFASTCGIV